MDLTWEQLGYKQKQSLNLYGRVTLPFYLLKTNNLTSSPQDCKRSYYRTEVGSSSMGAPCAGDFYITCETPHDGHCAVNTSGI